jgi:hypothetical protein
VQCSLCVSLFNGPDADTQVALEAAAAWQRQPLRRRQEYLDRAFEQAAANGQTATTWAAINLYLQTYDDVVAGCVALAPLNRVVYRGGERADRHHVGRHQPVPADLRRRRGRVRRPGTIEQGGL